jgi:hypothetical protein
MSAVVTATLWEKQRAPRRHEEADLLHASMHYLDWALPPDAVACHSPGEGKRSKSAQIALRRSGYKAGWPDICIVYRGRALFVELKTAKGVMSAAQKAMTRKLVYCGADVICARSLPDLEAALREACVPLKASVAA